MLAHILLLAVLAVVTPPSQPAARSPEARAAAAYAALVAMAPPARVRPASPRWQETPEQIETRYRAVAADIAAASDTAWDVALLVGIAVHEGFAADVYAGQCVQKAGWCPDGAVSVYQLVPPTAALRERYRTDPRAAALAALVLARGSWWRCARIGRASALSAYAAGTCQAHGPAAATSAELVRYVDSAARYVRAAW